jgi:hypothetical protein
VTERKHPIVLTGPPAAALHGLDGFAEMIWPLRYACARQGSGGPGTLATRHWIDPVWIGDQPVAAVPLLLRHLNAIPADLEGCADRISPRDRVELAVEHARRLGHFVTVPASARGPGDQLLRTVRRLSGSEPPTESFAETNVLQWCRSVGLSPWRQLEIEIAGRRYRVDFGFPLRGGRRPLIVRPCDVLLCELDSRTFHQDRFEQDYERRNAFDRAGFHHIELTPNEVARHPHRALASLTGALRKAGAR